MEQTKKEKKLLYKIEGLKRMIKRKVKRKNKQIRKVCDRRAWKEIEDFYFGDGH